MAMNILADQDKKVDAQPRANVCLQAWDAKKVLKPKDLIDMMKVARKTDDARPIN